eukprot:1854797-Pleurochrysis_carterae.AAC.1
MRSHLCLRVYVRERERVRVHRCTCAGVHVRVHMRERERACMSVLACRPRAAARHPLRDRGGHRGDRLRRSRARRRMPRGSRCEGRGLARVRQAAGE